MPCSFVDSFVERGLFILEAFRFFDTWTIESYFTVPYEVKYVGTASARTERRLHLMRPDPARGREPNAENAYAGRGRSG